MTSTHISMIKTTHTILPNAKGDGKYMCLGEQPETLSKNSNDASSIISILLVTKFLQRHNKIGMT